MDTISRQDGAFDEGEFICLACSARVPVNEHMGTKHRNHCPVCLVSKHVDRKVSGDRAAECGARMDAVGLTFKHEGTDKWGKPKQGELMLIHRCDKCKKISINRIAADDDTKAILALLGRPLSGELGAQLREEGIAALGAADETKVCFQLFGRSGAPQ